MAEKITTVAIVPSDSGFGEWQRGLGSEKKVNNVREAASIYADVRLQERAPTVIRVEDLCDDDNISGRIRDEPRQVYATPSGYGDYIYFGVL